MTTVNIWGKGVPNISPYTEFLLPMTENCKITKMRGYWISLTMLNYLPYYTVGNTKITTSQCR